MRRLFLPLVVLVLAGMLHGAASPAAACVCGPLPLEQIVSGTPIIVVGHTTEDLEGHGVGFEVERYLKGSGPYWITVNDIDRDGPAYSLSDCSLGINHRLERQILFLTATEVTHLAWKCSGNKIISDDAEGQRYIEEVLAAANAPSSLPDGGGRPAQEEPETGDDDLPWYVFLAGAFLIPMAVLVVPVFLASRRGDQSRAPE